MSVHYLDLSIGAPRRLAILRKDAAEWNSKHPHAPLQNPTWRQMRHGKLTDSRGLSQGYNVTVRSAWGRTTEERVPVWYTHDGQEFSREQFADEVVPLRHRGWYTDREFQTGTYRGIVAALPHGRFLAGYYSSDNGERVYFAELYDSGTDAARSADQLAQQYSEQEADFQDLCRAAQVVQDRIEENERRLSECLALRNDRRPCFAHMRDEARRCIEAIREARAELASDYAGVLS